MKRLIAVLCLVAVLLCAWVIPVSASNITGIKYQIGVGPKVYALGLGNGYDQVGTVTVWLDSYIDPTIVYVKYDMTDEYVMQKTHLAVLVVPDGTTVLQAVALLPSTSPGQFDKKPMSGTYQGAAYENHKSSDNTDTTYTYEIDGLDLELNGWLFIAAHADLDGGTAWANGAGEEPPTTPLPELPSVTLLGIGLAGIGTAYILIKRKQTVTAK